MKMERGRRANWLSDVFRCATAAGIALLLVHGAGATPPRKADSTTGGDSTIRMELSFEHMKLTREGWQVTGGDWDLGKVTLSQAAPKAGAKIKTQVMVNGALSKDVKISPLEPKSLSVPGSATSVSFKVITSPVKKAETATVTATYVTATYGAITATAKIVLEPNGVASVAVKPGTVNAGGSAAGTVQLKHPAPEDVDYYKNIALAGQPSVYIRQERLGGATVTLTSSNGAVKVPNSVAVKSGGTSAEFTATASTLVSSASQSSSCSMGPSPLSVTITATWEQPGTGTLQVRPNNNSTSRYTSQTIRIDPKTILGVSHDAHALVLDGSDKCVQSLTSGSVMFLKSLGVLKVVKLMKVPKAKIADLRLKQVSSDGVAVAVSSASLTDFINDGTFQVFRQTMSDASEPGGDWKQGLGPDQPTGGDGDWKYKVSGTGTNYSFTAFKQNGGLSASVSGKGQMTKVDYNFLTVIHSDKLQQATYTVDTAGTLDVDWLVQTTAAGQGIGESRLRLPAMHSGLVDSADNIPLLLQVYGNLIFKPGFGEKAAAQGHFKITYSGEGGIDGSSALNQGLDTKADIDSTTSSAKAAHGAVVAINAPKFALSLSTVSFLWAADARLPGALNSKGADLADSLQAQLGSYVKADLKPPTTDDLFKVRRAAYVMWVSSVAYAGSGLMGVGLMSSVPCQQYYQTYVASAGIDKDMLGSISGSVPPDKGVEVFKKEKTTLIPAIKGCEPKK